MKNRKSKGLRNANPAMPPKQTGSATLIVIFIAAIIVATIPFLLRVPKLTRQHQDLIHTTAAILRQDIIRNLSDNLAWSLTLKDLANVGMSCLDPSVSPAVACIPGEKALQLRDSANQIFIASNQTAGFDLGGQPCSAFGTSGSPCVLNYTLTWSPICPSSGSCLLPPVQIKGTLSYSQALGVPLKTKTFDIFFVR